jgi:hypothetical protein
VLEYFEASHATAPLRLVRLVQKPDRILVPRSRAEQLAPQAQRPLRRLGVRLRHHGGWPILAANVGLPIKFHNDVNWRFRLEKHIGKGVIPAGW